jgi:CubicO group peptidase (beta-lactamase class C family)
MDVKRIRIAIHRIIVLSSLFLSFTATCVAQDLALKMDEYLNAVVKQGRFSGSVLVARDGNVILSKGYSLANVEWNRPNTPQTKFRLGSVTKQFTAASILLLQEGGKLNVQDPLCKYITDCPEAWKEITIHHLLSHTGGIPNFTSFPDYTKTEMIPATIESIIARFKDKPLDFKPSEKWTYSNSGYILLGYIVEKASGQSYERFLQENIFGPLKMTNSGYDRNSRVIKQRAAGYSHQGDEVVNSAYMDMTIPHGGGALYSTVEDLYLWEQALFGGKLLQSKSLEAMTTVVKNDYAYGLGVKQQFNRKSISHAGGINGFATFLAYYPDDRVTVAVLRNFDDGSLDPTTIANDMAAIVFGEKYEIPRERVAIKLDPKFYDAYIGQYQLGPNLILTIAKEGDRLMTEVTGQPKIELFPESETKFFFRVMDALVTFIKDEKGKVTGLILYLGGEQRAKKIK